MQRRHKRTGGCLALAGLLFLMASPALAERVGGRVFLDANANGQFDTGEQGLGGVPVSDGVAFVTTDDDGRYSIDAKLDEALQPDRGDKRPIVTVSFPNGTWPTAGWFRRLDAVRDPAAVDFPLRREKQELPFVFIHGTDPHVPRGGRDLFPRFRKDAEALKGTARFCILTGDLSTDSFPRETCAGMALFAAQTKDFPLPLFCAPGNHDCAGAHFRSLWDPRDPLGGYGLYWKHVGPLRWSFNYGGCHFVGIDFMTLEGEEWVNGVPPAAVRWLRRDLEAAPKDARVLLFVHQPRGGQELEAVAKEFGVKHFFAGHTHLDRQATFAGIQGWESGSLSDPNDKDREPGFRLVLVSKDSVETFYHPLGEPRAIVLDAPRNDAPLGASVTVRGALLAPGGKADGLTVRIGGVGGAFPLQKTPIGCRFEAPIDLSKVPEGFRRLEVTASQGDTTWRYARNCLVLNGNRYKFEAPGEAKLVLEVVSLGVDFDVSLNGKPLASVKSTELEGELPPHVKVKITRTATLPIPQGALQRLNVVELHAKPAPDSKPDDFCVMNVAIRMGRNEFRDPRIVVNPEKLLVVRGKATFYVDLMAD